MIETVPTADIKFNDGRIFPPPKHDKILCLSHSMVASIGVFDPVSHVGWCALPKIGGIKMLRTGVVMYAGTHSIGKTTLARQTAEMLNTELTETNLSGLAISHGYDYTQQSIDLDTVVDFHYAALQRIMNLIKNRDKTKILVLDRSPADVIGYYAFRLQEHLPKRKIREIITEVIERHRYDIIEHIQITPSMNGGFPVREQTNKIGTFYLSEDHRRDIQSCIDAVTYELYNIDRRSIKLAETNDIDKTMQLNKETVQSWLEP